MSWGHWPACEPRMKRMLGALLLGRKLRKLLQLRLLLRYAIDLPPPFLSAVRLWSWCAQHSL